jgi:hypothetical protein
MGQLPSLDGQIEEMAEIVRGEIQDLQVILHVATSVCGDT